MNREDKEGVRKWFAGTQGIPEVENEVRAIQCGGHFDGSLVLLWEREKRLFIADTMMSVPVSLKYLCEGGLELMPYSLDSIRKIACRGRLAIRFSGRIRTVSVLTSLILQ